MRDKKIIVVAKCYDSNMNGPANIVRCLVEEFNNMNVSYEVVLLKENISKFDFLKQLVNTLKNSQTSTINVHTDGFLIPLLVYICSHVFRRHSYYLTVHGIYKIEAEMAGKAKKHYILLESFLYKHFPNIICVSEMLRKNIEVIYGRKKNVSVIPNATDADSNLVFVRNKPIELITLGGLRKRKGIDILLDLAEYFKKNALDFHISIYGVDEGNKQKFDGEVEKRLLGNFVKYKGQLNNKQDVYDKVRTADFQLCLSLYDTYNVAIAESLVLGCPCIATDKCGASYLIRDRVNGIVVKNEQREFQRILDYIMSFDETKRRKIEVESEKFKEALSWRKIANQYSNLA